MPDPLNIDEAKAKLDEAFLTADADWQKLDRLHGLARTTSGAGVSMQEMEDAFFAYAKAFIDIRIAADELEKAKKDKQNG